MLWKALQLYLLRAKINRGVEMQKVDYHIYILYDFNLLDQWMRQPDCVCLV